MSTSGAIDAIAGAIRIHAALKSKGRVGIDAERACLALDHRRIEIGRLQEHAACVRCAHAFQSTHHAAQNDIEARELDFLRVEGKKLPIRVYELAALKGDLSPVKREAYAIFSDALQLYRARRFVEARAEFLRVTSLLPGDRPSNLYIDRCDQFTQSPPPADWDGVFVMTSK